MKIAVLGATGMLGHHAACAVLDAGYQLVVVYRNPDTLKRLAHLKFEARRADLGDSESLEKAFLGLDGVINAAAYYPVEPRPWQEDVTLALAQNENFYRAAEASNVAKLVYLGGAIALPKRTDGMVADGTERYSETPRSSNGYLQSKWAMDEQALAWAKRGLNVCIGIPAMSFGEYDSGTTTGQFVSGIASGKLKSYVQGKRNVVYAGDAGRGLVQAVERGVKGARYLLTGSNTNMAELTALIAAKAKVDPPKPVPLIAAKFLSHVQKLRWRLLDGPVPQISDTAIAVMSAGQHLDGGRSQMIGYAPKVGLDETIDRALRWARAEGQC
jgi:dihydroflavonol-4-reductase